MQRVSPVTLLAVSTPLLLAACADEPTRPSEPAVRIAAAGVSLTSGAPLAFRQMSAGGGQTCGVTTINVAYCWGRNGEGQLGVGNTRGPDDCDPDPFNVFPCSTQPVRVIGGLAFREVAAGDGHTCAVTTSDVTYCWGQNDLGQLGIGNHTGPELCFGVLPCSTRPVRVAGGVTFRQVSAGSVYTCGVTTENVVYCWGANRAGQLGLGTSTGPETCVFNGQNFACSTRPARLVGGLAFRAVGSNGDHTCAITTASRAFCWGENTFGQLGAGTSTGPETCGQFDAPCSTRPVAVVAPRP